MSRISVKLAFVLAALVAAPAMAQPTLDTNSAGTVYRLNDDATYQEGCFDPCLCPIGAPLPTIGTFVLGPAVIGNVVDFRDVREINWQVLQQDNPIKITGSGVYTITNYGLPQMHALELDLSIDGGEPQHFWSDYVPVTSNDGTIDIPISMNGVFCYDIVIQVSASPVPAREIRPYRLIRGSTFQRGCFDPCDCPLEAPRHLRGTFQLVQLLDYGTYRVYAVVRARFNASWRNASFVDTITLRGFGTYVHIDGFAGPIHSLDLTLQVDEQGPYMFDSGLLNTDPIFPAVDIVVDMNDQVCFDTVLTLKARPLTNISSTASAPSLSRHGG